VPLRSLLMRRDAVHPQSHHPLLYIAQPIVQSDALPLHSSDPEGNFRGNQLLGRSMSLSPLCTTLTNDLHVSTGLASTTVSHGFTMVVHSSPPFGSHHNHARNQNPVQWTRARWLLQVKPQQQRLTITAPFRPCIND